MRIAGMLVCAMLSLAQTVNGEEAGAERAATQPPTRIPVSGVLQTLTGEPRAGEVTFVLSIYADRDSAEPLFAEEQTVVLPDDGRYELALGATSEHGLPVDLFEGRGARWVGIAEKGDLEQPRFMLVSVPYATKALDADAVGGRPVKDFVLAEELDEKVASVLAEGRAQDVAPSGLTQADTTQTAERVRSFTLDLKPRTEADAPVAAAGRFTNEATAGEMYGVHAHVHSTTGGSFDAAPTGVFGEVNAKNPGAYSAGVRGINRGTSGLGVGVLGMQYGSGWGVFGSTPNGIGVLGSSETGVGVRGDASGSLPAVVASHNGLGDGTALEVSNGGIKVSGSTRAAFVRTTAEDSRHLWIDHPLTNGNSNAVLFVTQRGQITHFGASPIFVCCGVNGFGVAYDGDIGRWAIIADAAETIPAGTSFNILVIDQ